MWRNISKYYPPWLDLVLILLMVMAGLYTHGQYAALPERFPTHFGFQGLPDAWKEKSLLNVYLPLLIGIATCSFISGLNYFCIVKPEDPRRFINLPINRKAPINAEKLEALRQNCIYMMISVNVLMAGIFTVIQIGAVEVALSRKTGLGIMIYVFMVLLLMVIVYFSAKLISIASHKEAG